MPTCVTGYAMLNNFNTRLCEHINTWSGSAPSCLRIICDHPDEFNNVHYNENNDTYDFGSVLIPTCDKGFIMSNGVYERVCENINFWSGNNPICEIIMCFRPTVLNGLLIRTRNFYNYNTHITIQCNTNFEIQNGIYTRTCQEDGIWGSDTLQCVKILCNDTSDVIHESVGVYPQLAIGEIGGVLYNSTVFYLQSGSVDVNCSMDRKLTWITTPVFGMFCNLLMELFTLNVAKSLHDIFKGVLVLISNQIYNYILANNA